MLSQFGIEASRAAQYVIAFAIILVLVALFGLVLRKLTGGRMMMGGQDRSRARQPRLGVVDIYDLDRQRQLVLLRRDNVEHLLLIGGLNDVVIETNIVRVSGARIPAANIDQGDRFDPGLEPGRPQVETPVRPSIETQLAAQLGSFMKRPSGESSDDEPSPAGMSRAPEPPRVEPSLKSDAPAFAASPSIYGFRPANDGTSGTSAPAVTPPQRPLAEPQQGSPEPPPVRSEPRQSYVKSMFQSRPTPAAKPVTPPPPPAPPAAMAAPSASIAATPAYPAEPVDVAAVEAADRGAPDAGVLSDMAKQLEEALKRPTPAKAERSVPEPASALIEDNPDLDEDDLLEPAMPRDPQLTTVPTEQASPSPAAPSAAEQPAESHGPPAPPPAEPEATPVTKTDEAADPFSVEEIEAEFARLLGRPLDSAKKG